MLSIQHLSGMLGGEGRQEDLVCLFVYLNPIGVISSHLTHKHIWSQIGHISAMPFSFPKFVQEHAGNNSAHSFGLVKNSTEVKTLCHKVPGEVTH